MNKDFLSEPDVCDLYIKKWHQTLHHTMNNEPQTNKLWVGFCLNAPEHEAVSNSEVLMEGFETKSLVVRQDQSVSLGVFVSMDTASELEDSWCKRSENTWKYFWTSQMKTNVQLRSPTKTLSCFFMCSRLVHGHDCLDKKLYPLLTHKHRSLTQKCAVCHVFIGRWVQIWTNSNQLSELTRRLF